MLNHCFSLQDFSRTEASLKSVSPVIAANDWISITDLESGGEVGQLRVVLAAGSYDQIRLMSPQLNVETKQKQGDLDHSYDSVPDSSASEDKITPIYEKFDDKEVTKPEIHAVQENMDRENLQRRIYFEDEFRERPIDDTLTTEVTILEARNLPRVFDPRREGKILPRAFATFTAAGQRNPLTTEVAEQSISPHWNAAYTVKLSTSNFQDPRHCFIVKVWHHLDQSRSPPDLEHDQVIGFAAIALLPLAYGLPSICGWYNVMDFSGRCRGQIKVGIKVSRSDRTRLASLDAKTRSSELFTSSKEESGENPNFVVSASYSKFPSHVIGHTEQMVTATPVPNITTPSILETDPGNVAQSVWRAPELGSVELGDTRSFLAKKLSELSLATDKLKGKLNEEKYPSIHDSLASELNSFSDIRRKIDENLERLQKSALSNVTYRVNNDAYDNIDVISVTSAEIVNICSSEDDGDESPRATLQPPPHFSTSKLNVSKGTLEELESIDWREISSRLLPEGEDSESKDLANANDANSSSG